MNHELYAACLACKGRGGIWLPIPPRLGPLLSTPLETRFTKWHFPEPFRSKCDDCRGSGIERMNDAKATVEN